MIGSYWPGRVTCSSLKQSFHPKAWKTLIGQAQVTCSHTASRGEAFSVELPPGSFFLREGNGH